jgi:hypothetical protein
MFSRRFFRQALVTVMALMLAAATGCNRNSGLQNSSGGNANSGSPQPPQPLPQPNLVFHGNAVPSPPPPIDLRIVNVSVRRNSGDPNERQIVAVVQNAGDVDATFNGGCEWDCPGGLVTHAGADFVQGGFLQGRHQSPYSETFRPQCVGPPALLNFNCKLEWNGRVVNQWSGQVQLFP